MSSQGKTTLLGKVFILAFIALCFAGAYHFFFQGSPEKPSTLDAIGFNRPQAPVSIGIAYGTEKRLWLEWATKEFVQTPAGRHIKINLLPYGSQEGAQAIVQGDQRIHAWLPANSLYKKGFIDDWQANHELGAQPILKEEILALTPMVLVIWEQRYQAFTQKYAEVTFKTIGEALSEKTGWASIAQKPDWGLFKFGHTNPTESNSGFLTLLLMAYDFAGKCKDLTVADTISPAFQNWLYEFEGAVTGLSNSTGNLMREMVLKGPSAYDALFVYENVAIDYLKSAQGRWDNLYIAYPRLNVWNDNPFYLLDVPWSSQEQSQAAQAFLDFLLSVPAQQRALEHGFRPGDPSIPIKEPNSPFSLYQKYGLKIDITRTCEMPAPDVIHNLRTSWQRAHGR